MKRKTRTSWLTVYVTKNDGTVVFTQPGELPRSRLPPSNWVILQSRLIHIPLLTTMPTPSQQISRGVPPRNESQTIGITVINVGNGARTPRISGLISPNVVNDATQPKAIECSNSVVELMIGCRRASIIAVGFGG